MFDINLELIINYGSMLLFSLALSYIGYVVFRKYITPLAIKIIQRTDNKWDDKVIESKIFYKISYLIPLMIFSYFLHFFPDSFADPVWKVIGFLSTWVLVFIVDKLLWVFGEVYNTLEVAKEKPIKGYIQLVKIVLYILGAIIAFCMLLGVSPWGVLSGIGALTAVLLFVFKDTILSLVASIQIAANNLFKVGDWIEVPGFGADGDVVDIALHSVKVQNFDKTIINIPTYKFLDTPFKNWRGMEKSGGRRIKRHLLVDLNTVRFCSDEEIENYKNIDLLKGYFENKKEVLESSSRNPLNSRRLTNIGTYRAYIKEYLNRNPLINNLEFTFLVRQLQATSKGLPIEVYVFSSDNRWVAYEEIQSDIFDHLIVAAGEFGLKLYQEPSGDLSCLSSLQK